MKKFLIRFGVFLIAAGLTARATAPAFSTALAVPTLSLNAWVANFRPDLATRALKQNARHLNELSLFSVGAKMDGELAPEVDFINRALKITGNLDKKPRVLLTVANIRPHMMHDRFLIDLWLGNQERWMHHAQDLLKLAENVDGLDLDYENLRRSDAREFEPFISYLANAMHARGKFLSVTVEHQTFMSGGMNWRQISHDADRVRIMAYHYHYERTQPGAVSPPGVVARLAQRALNEIPRDKLEIALPLYGFDWTVAGRGRLVPTLENFRSISRKKGAHFFRDRKTHSARVIYTTTERQGRRLRRIKHSVWYEDPQSAAYKVKMLQKLGIVHIGFWQLGAGNVSELFDLVRPPSNW